MSILGKFHRKKSTQIKRHNRMALAFKKAMQKTHIESGAKARRRRQIEKGMIKVGK